MKDFINLITKRKQNSSREQPPTAQDVFAIELPSDGDRLIAQGRASKEIFGRIQVGQFNETFPMSLKHWTPDQYRSQWVEGVERIVRGAQSSCLMISIFKPADPAKGHVSWWTLDREGENVKVNLQDLILAQIPGGFNERDLYSHLKHFPLKKSPNALVYEVPISALRLFLKK